MKIMDHVELIEGTMAHSYFIETQGKNVLVDTGTKGSGKKIVLYLEQKGLKPDIILITHYHMDHIGGLGELLEKFPSEVYAPGREIDIIAGKKGLPDGTPSFLKLFTRIPALAEPDRIKPSETLSIPGISVVETNGHTPGSTSYLFGDLGVLCVGDALYNKRGSLEVNKMFSLDMEKASKSRDKILSMKPVLVLPGHGAPVRI